MPTIPAQSAPKFDVASIKPCTSDDSRVGGEGPSHERLYWACTTAEQMIEGAYVISANDRFDAFASYIPISGGPKWVDSDRYQIDAKAEGPQDPKN
jgi:uncharacterized protein (TIGR03435 family)